MKFYMWFDDLCFTPIMNNSAEDGQLNTKQLAEKRRSLSQCEWKDTMNVS